MEILAVIPARGGSKGIPGKNLIWLDGRPLVAHTIQAAKRVSLISRVIVSTDDSEIARTAQECGAQVIMRPDDISGDTASSESAILHVMEHLHVTEGFSPDLLVFLQCTAPLTLPEDIEGTIRALLDQDADTALAVTHFHHFLWKNDGNAVGINHDKSIRQRRQECEPQYLETGAVYVMRTEGFLEAEHRFFGKTAMYVMPKTRCLEIDEPVDLVIADAMIRMKKNSSTF